MGTWAIAGGAWKFGWGPQDEQQAVDGVVRGIELGINWIDTAAVYGDGRSEELVGQALQQLPPSRHPRVATKCGRIFRPDGEIVGCLERPSLVAECEASLRRLRVETIDLYQIHWPDPDAHLEEAWETLADLVRQGKVRYIGVSNCSASQMRRLQPIQSAPEPHGHRRSGARDPGQQSQDLCQPHGQGIPPAERPAAVGGDRGETRAQQQDPGTEQHRGGKAR